MAAQLYPLPTSAPGPVLNEKRKGRFPRGVVSIDAGRTIRWQRAEAQAKRAREIAAPEFCLDTIVDHYKRYHDQLLEIRSGCFSRGLSNKPVLQI